MTTQPLGILSEEEVQRNVFHIDEHGTQAPIMVANLVTCVGFLGHAEIGTGFLALMSWS